MSEKPTIEQHAKMMEDAWRSAEEQNVIYGQKLQTLQQELNEAREDRDEHAKHVTFLCQENRRLEQELDRRKKNCKKHRRAWLEVNRRFMKFKDNDINRLQQENGRLREALKSFGVLRAKWLQEMTSKREADRKNNCRIHEFDVPLLERIVKEFDKAALSATDEPNAALEDDMSTEMLARVTARDV